MGQCRGTAPLPFFTIVLDLNWFFGPEYAKNDLRMGTKPTFRQVESCMID